MRNRSFTFIAVLLAAVLALTACGASPTAKSDAGPAYNGSGMQAEVTSQKTDTAKPANTMTTSDGKGNLSTDQKLIKTLRVEIETLEFDDTLSKLKALVAASGGYVESSTVSGQSYQSDQRRTASFTVRVPVSELEKTEEALSELGNVISSTANVSDITLTYADTASRVAALEAQRDSLLSMLQKAEDLKDLLTIQDHLTEVEYQLESYASKLRLMDNQVEYSSISLSIREVKIYTEPEPEDESFGARLSRIFKESLQRVGNFFEELALFVLGRLPILLIWGAFIAVIVLIARLIARKNRAKRMKRPVVPLQEPPAVKKD